MSKPRSKAKKVTFRNIKNVNMNCFKRDLSYSDLCSDKHDELSNPDDLDMLLNDYNTTLRAVLDCHAPLRTKILKVRTKSPGIILTLEKRKGSVER